MTRIGSRANPDLAGDTAQLAVEVTPLSHSDVVQMLVDAHPPEGVSRQLGLTLPEVIPQSDNREKVGARHLEAAMESISAVTVLSRTFAHILNRQGSGDDEHLADAAVPIRLDDHPADARIDRQSRETATEPRQTIATRTVIGLERTQFEQEPPSVGHLRRVGGLNEGEVIDPAKSERGHLQNDRGEACPEDLRLGELGARREILLGVEADAHPGRHATAATGPLGRRCLRDRFDREALHLRSPGVAADAGGARVDHRANPRYRDRGLRDIGGQHDPSTGMRSEHALLLGSGEPRVERQHLDPR